MFAMLGALAACGGDDGPGAEQARVRVDGAATVTRPDGTTTTVDDTSILEFGDVVHIDEGTASVEFADGSTYELRAGPDGAGELGSELRIEVPPTLLAGDALVVGRFPAAIDFDIVSVSAFGPVRVSATTSTASVYSGQATVTGVGATIEVQGLRSVVLTEGAVPEPIVFDGLDSWDRRYLAEAIAFGDRLEALARGFTNDLQPGRRSVSFYEAVLPALQAETDFRDEVIDPQRDTGETLVGAAIVVQATEGAFLQRWDAVFAFRDAGAAWGLVALDQGVQAAPVLQTVELAIGTSTLSDSPPPTDAPSTSRPQRPTTTSTSSPPTQGPPTSGPPPTAPPPTPPTDDGILSPVVDPLAAILDELLGVLGLG